MLRVRGQATGPSRTFQGIAYHEGLANGWSQRYRRGGFKRRATFFEDAILSRASCTGDWIDVGCGSGHFSRILARRGATVLGIDGSPAMIEAARAFPAPPRQRYKLQRIEDLEGQEAQFDGVLCLSVLEYLEDPPATFAAIVRMLKPGGYLIASAPNRNAALRRLQLAARRLAAVFGVKLFAYLDSSRHSWSRDEFAALAEQHGLTRREIKSFDPLAPRLLWDVAPSLLFLVCRKPEAGCAE